MSIIVSMPSGETKKLEESGFQSEASLQRYMTENPEILPLDEYKEDTRLLILAREFATRSGAIDALGVDQDGEVYVIETKLYKNADKRLVLAQLLDYGASLWRTFPDPAELVGRLRDSAEKEFGTDLGDKLKDTFGLGEPELDDFFESLTANIKDGNFRFVVLMDRIGDRLKDLITFVNQNSRFDVFGVDLEFYRHEEMQIVVPRLYGAEVKKTVESSGGSPRQPWNEEKFFEDAENRLRPQHLEAVRRLYVWAVDNADRVSWGTGSQRGSFNPKFHRVHPSRSVFTVYSDGELVLRFGWLAGSEETNPYVDRLGLALRERVPALSVPEEFRDQHSTVPVETWAPDLSEFIAVLEDVLADAYGATGSG